MDPERKEPFTDFVQTAVLLGEAEFKDRYKHPFLVFIENETVLAGSKLIDTPPEGIDLCADTNQIAVGANARAAFEKSLSCVLIIEKTKRNPFDTMITVGRSLNNDIILPFPSVSKFHAYFTRPHAENAPWRLVDQTSKNGTFVEANQLKPMEAVDLRPGQFITFGNDTNAIFLSPEALWDYISSNKPLV